jgi:hypothetical protein
MAALFNVFFAFVRASKHNQSNESCVLNATQRKAPLARSGAFDPGIATSSEPWRSSVGSAATSP